MGESIPGSKIRKATVRRCFDSQKARAPTLKPVAAVEEQILVAQNDAPAQPPSQETDIQTIAVQVLPQTGGNSDLELMAGLTLLGSGLATVLAFRRNSVA
jgi:LPXTG-motif cell wall-anchored protein